VVLVLNEVVLELVLDRCPGSLAIEQEYEYRRNA
jgi:hypothetical protein